MTFPEGGYWHVEIYLKETSWPIRILDKHFNFINESIVKPYCEYMEFIADGTRIKNRDEISSIKIVHSPNNSEFYGEQSLSSENVIFFAAPIALVFSREPLIN